MNVINESFGDNEFPDTTQDVIKLFDNAAVGAARWSPPRPATRHDVDHRLARDRPGRDLGRRVHPVPDVRAVRLRAARYFSTGWLDDNTSGLSSSGYTEQGATVDLVAPGDLSWASCDANTARFSDCSSLLGNPSSIEISGGTSESSPFVAGAAALVIQAYRTTHGGSTPAPRWSGGSCCPPRPTSASRLRSRGRGCSTATTRSSWPSRSAVREDRLDAARVGHPA